MSSSLLTLRASTKRALLLQMALLIGYVLGFQDGKVFASPVLGILLVVAPLALAVAVAAKTIAAFIFKRRNGGGSGGWG